MQDGEDEEDHDGDETAENEALDQTADNDTGTVVEEKNEPGNAITKSEQDATAEETKTDSADPKKTDGHENGDSETAGVKGKTVIDTTEDNILAEKVDNMLADKEGDDLIDLDKDGLLDDVSFSHVNRI